ncbi:hypothetical protein A5707_12075 [Mycobacterium kyorinense]|uniref:Uncharacterized protein n=1 Tax=Mycobacterium kyorinense TaxID=487514 RepID=A0A1A2ZQ02_9MYCO|nr:hypothetical protein A5707_12075 [Mycobacterium kyorinense]
MLQNEPSRSQPDAQLRTAGGLRSPRNLGSLWPTDEALLQADIAYDITFEKDLMVELWCWSDSW